MNVFVLDRDHKTRARYHCDTHVNKMLLEGAQILNTALHKNDVDDDLVFYQATHENHPWCEWAADRFANWQWLHNHAICLEDEFLKRSEKDEHATAEKMKQYWDGRTKYIEPHFDDGPRSEFPICTRDFEPESDNVVEAYREYYVAKKVPQDWATWTNGVPEWVLELQ